MAPWVKPAAGGRFLLAAENFYARTSIRTNCRVRFRAPPSMPTAPSKAMPAWVDQARDMMMRGAFAHTLAARGIRRVPMLFQHDPSEPVGIWLDLREDHRGLIARGRLIPEVARGRELLSLLRAGAIDGLSIGFRTAKARMDLNTRIRRLFAVDLWEISIVTFPMLMGARVRAVKHSHARTLAEREWWRCAARLRLSRHRIGPNFSRVHAVATALTQSDRLALKQKTLLKLFVKSDLLPNVRWHSTDRSSAAGRPMRRHKAHIRERKAPIGFATS
jgi:uncharacterized protein